MIYPVAIVQGNGELGRGLERVRVGGLTVIAAQRTRPPTPERHLALLGRIDYPALLPFRYGSAASGPEEIRRGLKGQLAELRKALRRVDGCVQMIVRVPAGQPTSGRSYLESRSRAPELGGLYALVRAEKQLRAGRRLTAFHLVPKSHLADYRAAVRRVRGARVTGPFPPFAFAP
jgi:hypothetical protein